MTLEQFFTTYISNQTSPIFIQIFGSVLLLICVDIILRFILGSITSLIGGRR